MLISAESQKPFKDQTKNRETLSKRYYLALSVSAIDPSGCHMASKKRAKDCKLFRAAPACIHVTFRFLVVVFALFRLFSPTLASAIHLRAKANKQASTALGDIISQALRALFTVAASFRFRFRFQFSRCDSMWLSSARRRGRAEKLSIVCVC